MLANEPRDKVDDPPEGGGELTRLLVESEMDVAVASFRSSDVAVEALSEAAPSTVLDAGFSDTPAWELESVAKEL